MPHTTCHMPPAKHCLPYATRLTPPGAWDLQLMPLGAWSPQLSKSLDGACGVAGKSVSHHHRHSAWQRTEPRRVCGDTGMTEMGWATAAYGDAGVTEMGCATGSIFLGDPGVDRLPSHLVSYISSHLTSSYHTRTTHSIIPNF